MDPLLVILLVVLLLWVGGFAYGVGSAIHFLLIIVVVVIVIRLLRGQSI